MSKKKQLDNIQESQNELLERIKRVDSQVQTWTPITGGNAYAKEQEHVARIRANVDSINSQKTKLTVVSDWYQLALIANYWKGVFRIKTTNLNLRRIWPSIVEGCFLYGGCAITQNDDGKLCPYAIAKSELGEDMEITKATLIPLSKALQTQSTFTNAKLNYKQDKENVSKESHSGNSVYFKWGSNGFSAWLFMVPYLKALDANRKVAQMTYNLSSKKLMMNLKDKDGSTEELAALLDPLHPGIINTSQLVKDATGNHYSLIDHLKDGSGGMREQIEYIKWFKEEWQAQLGIRTSTADTSERGNTAKTEYAQNQYAIVINDIKEHLIIGLEQMKLKWKEIDQEATIEEDTINEIGTLGQNETNNNNPRGEQ